MAAPTNILKDQVQNLLSDAVTVLCKNTLLFHTELCVEGLLGITLDKKDVVLINIKEIIDRSNLGRDINTTCRECKGFGRVMLHADGQQHIHSDARASLSNSHPRMGTSASVSSQPPVRTVVSPLVMPQGQRQIFQSVSKPNDFLQHSAPQREKATTIVVPQEQQHPSVVFTSNSGINESVDVEVGGHLSEDEVAATIIKKPRIYRNPRKVIAQPELQVSIADAVTNSHSNNYNTQTVSVASASPQQKLIHVKREHVEPLKDSAISIHAAENAELDLFPMGGKNISIKRTLSHEASQSPHPPKIVASSPMESVQTPPNVIFSSQQLGDVENFEDINYPSIPTSEDFYAFFTTGKLDVAGTGTSGDGASDIVQEMQPVQELQSGEIMTQNLQNAARAAEEASVAVCNPYMGSIEISPKSLSEIDAIVTDGGQVHTTEQDGGSQSRTGQQSAKDVGSAQIVFLDEIPGTASSEGTSAAELPVNISKTRKLMSKTSGKFGPTVQVQPEQAKNLHTINEGSSAAPDHSAGEKSSKIFFCPYCNKVFIHRASLVRHKRIHRGKFCACSLCGKKFHRRDVLNRHLAMHRRTSQQKQHLHLENEHDYFSEQTVHTSDSVHSKQDVHNTQHVYGEQSLHNEQDNSALQMLREQSAQSLHKEQHVRSDPIVQSQLVHNEPVVQPQLVHNEPNVQSQFVHNEPNVHSQFVHNEPNVHSQLVHNEPNVHSQLVHNEPNVHSQLVHNEPNVHSQLVHNEPNVHSQLVHNDGGQHVAMITQVINVEETPDLEIIEPDNK